MVWYCLDCEFSEAPTRIDLISIALIAQDGRTFYRVSADFDPATANTWVRDNVMPHLYAGVPYDRNITLPRTEIAKDVLAFIGDDREPIFWGYYSAYDWVVFCWLFGPMVALPPTFPMYCRDLRHTLDDRGFVRHRQPETAMHHALDDARWIARTLQALEGATLRQ